MSQITLNVLHACTEVHLTRRVLFERACTLLVEGLDLIPRRLQKGINVIRKQVLEPIASSKMRA